MKRLTQEEYRLLKEAVEHLPWIWNRYVQSGVNDWYRFKYQQVLRHFCANGEGEPLFNQVTPIRWRHQVRMPRDVYLELKELAGISHQLQDILAHPPYGTASLPHSLLHASDLIGLSDKRWGRREE